MKFVLNTEKSPFCTVGPFSFTFGNEEHDIDVGELPDEYKKQLLYNVNRQVLMTDDREGLASLSGSLQKNTPVPQEQIPLKASQVAQKAAAIVKDPIKEDLKPFRTLLRQTVATVKKEANGYNPSQLRKLLDLERENKNRKSVVNFIAEKLAQHEMSVIDSIGPDVAPADNPYAIDPLRSTQITNVVESDVERVAFNQGDLLPQEVLVDSDQE